MNSASLQGFKSDLPVKLNRELRGGDTLGVGQKTERKKGIV